MSGLYRSLAFLLVFPLLAACGSRSEMDNINTSGTGMARLGQLMQDKGEVGAAIDFYRRSLAAEPGNRRAILGLGSVLEKWGDKTAALDVYRDGVAVRGEDGELRRAYARLLLALDNPMEARKQYEAALKIDRNDMKARSGLGVALDYLGEHKDAQKQYEEVLDDQPRNLSALNNLAYSYILGHRYDRAIKLLEPELKNPAATPALRQNLALAYGLAGMEADAQRVSAMDLSPEKVAENMDYYRRQRAEIAVTTAPYAELCTYATEAMAAAQIKKMQATMEKEGKRRGDYKPVILPQVSSPGGTPRFAVRMMGCSRPGDISNLCQTLAPLGIPCTTQGR